MWRGVDKTTNDVRFITSAVIHKDFDEDTSKTDLPTGQGSFSDCFHNILPSDLNVTEGTPVFHLSFNILF